MGGIDPRLAAANRIIAEQNLAIVAMTTALKTMRTLINEGGVPRYTVTPGAAFNSFVEEVLDPVLRIGEPQ